MDGQRLIDSPVRQTDGQMYRQKQMDSQTETDKRTGGSSAMSTCFGMNLSRLDSAVR